MIIITSSVVFLSNVTKNLKEKVENLFESQANNSERCEPITVFDSILFQPVTKLSILVRKV